MSDAREPDNTCPNCGAPPFVRQPEQPETYFVWACGFIDDESETQSSVMCDYAAGLLNENDWLKREADAADRRAERAEAAILMNGPCDCFDHPAGPCEYEQLYDELKALEAGDDC